MSDAELGARVDAAAYLASAATYLDRYDEAVVHAERASGSAAPRATCIRRSCPALGAAHFMRGRLGEAAKVLDGGVEAARLAGVTQGMAWMLRNRVLRSRSLTGDLDGRARDGRGGAGADPAPGRERPLRVGGDGRRRARR